MRKRAVAPVAIDHRLPDGGKVETSLTARISEDLEPFLPLIAPDATDLG
jgi:hypothetical protein